MITNYRQASEFLESFIDYEKKVNFDYRRSFKLARVKKLFKQLKVPYHNFKIIHIAGTKGKGSTANLLAYGLVSLGCRVGLYTSPHLFDFRERIQMISPKPRPNSGKKIRLKKIEIERSLIAKRDVVRITARLKQQFNKLKHKESEQISFFEIYTALAFIYFNKQEPDYLIIETGLGGRLDATNLVKPKVSIITHIGYDHTHLLGSKLSQIAGEKAGIIKTGVPVISARQKSEALAVIKQQARRRKARLFVLGRDFKVSNLKLNPASSCFKFTRSRLGLKNINISLLGRYQAENAALALMALTLLEGRRLDDSLACLDLAGCRLKGRFQRIAKEPLILVDVAHNPSSFKVLADNLKIYYPNKKVILIFGCSQDKSAFQMLNKITFSNLILTQSQNPRAASPAELKKYTRTKAFLRTDLKQALALARLLYRPGKLILISGSLFLVAEAKLAMKNSGFFRSFG